MSVSVSVSVRSGMSRCPNHRRSRRPGQQVRGPQLRSARTTSREIWASRGPRWLSRQYPGVGGQPVGFLATWSPPASQVRKSTCFLDNLSAHKTRIPLSIPTRAPAVRAQRKQQCQKAGRGERERRHRPPVHGQLEIDTLWPSLHRNPGSSQRTVVTGGLRWSRFFGQPAKDTDEN